MAGKVLLLPLEDGESELPKCAICHSIVDDDAEPVTFDLEFRLRLNPMLSNDADSFGIAWDFGSDDVNFQMICGDCLTSKTKDPGGQQVKTSIFTIDFHKKVGNIDLNLPDRVTDIFANAPGNLNQQLINHMRNRFERLGLF